MRVNQAFRFELAPNAAQRRALARHVGAARLHREWNRWKRENAPWWVEVSKCAPQEAFRDLERALRRWRAGLAGRPRFKKKKRQDDNKARLTGAIRVFPRRVQLPRIGRVRTKEKTDKLLCLLETGKARVLSATVSREADRWYVALTCEVERPDPEPREGASVGVDLGLASFLTLSDGTTVEPPKPLARALELLRRRSRQLSRKQEGSRNHAKASLRLARLHRRVRNIRRDFLHKVTTWLAKTKPVIVVEDLNVRGLMRGWHARAVADVGWGAFRRMLEYKARWYGAGLIVAPRDFPSTRRCSGCGWVAPKLPLSERTFRCDACGRVLDRDLNAARNLQSYGRAARGGEPSRKALPGVPREVTPVEIPLAAERGRPRSTSYGSMKQEVAGRLWNPPG